MLADRFAGGFVVPKRSQSLIIQEAKTHSKMAGNAMLTRGQTQEVPVGPGSFETFQNMLSKTGMHACQTTSFLTCLEVHVTLD